MFYVIIFIALAALAYWYWRTRYIPTQVARNLAAFDADGAADTLQRGFHSREVWRRVWPALACCVVPALPLCIPLFKGQGIGGWAPALGFLAMAVLLTGCFARFFTPLLNEARTPTRPDITTWYASPASKSWPDAAAWVEVRKSDYATPAAQQAAADARLKGIVLSTWRYCLLAAALLSLGAVAVAVLHS